VLDFAYDPPNREPGKPWKWILVDSAIIAAIAFIAALPPDRPPTVAELYTALRAFAYAFLVQVATERGLKKYVLKKEKGETEKR
jgi:anti-sigma-K factor RskA